MAHAMPPMLLTCMPPLPLQQQRKVLAYFAQGARSTFYAGSYTLVNTHEIAIISGLAAAYRLGADYAFADDQLAADQFDLFLSINHGRRRKRVS